MVCLQGFYTYVGEEQVLWKSQIEADVLNWEGSQWKQVRCGTAVRYGHKRRKENGSIVAVYK